MSHLRPVTDATFDHEVLENDLTVVVDFWAPWCGPCRLVGPIVEELAAHDDGRVAFYKLDTDENPETALRYSVRSIPALLIFRDGELVKQIVGVRSKNVLTEAIDSVLTPLPAAPARQFAHTGKRSPMQTLAARTIVATASIALAAGVVGAFIALAVDDGDTTIIQRQGPPVADATGALAPPPPSVESIGAVSAAPALSLPPMLMIAGPDDDAYPTRVFQQVGSSVVLVLTRTGGGSGFFVDAQGHLVTNYHVVQDNDEVMIDLGNGNRVPGEVVGASPDNDLAVVKIDPSGLRIVPVRFGDSDALVVGERVAAIGNPFGLERTLTTGIVSALDRELPPLEPGLAAQRGAIQTDAAVNPGNSGGPLLNVAGEVVGVTSAAIGPIAGSVGLNFAIPVNTVARLLPELIGSAVATPVSAS